MSGEQCDVDCSDAVCCESDSPQASTDEDCCGTTIVVSALDTDGIPTPAMSIPAASAGIVVAELEPVVDHARPATSALPRVECQPPPFAPPELLCCFLI